MTEQLRVEKGHRLFAWFYPRMARRMERGIVGRLRRELLEGLRGRVIEIGAGNGLNFAHYPPEAQVVATEPDPYMRRQAEAARTPNVEVTAAPGERLPFDDASFDAAVSTLVLCTVANVQRTLAEIRRVLKPGGELRFIEHVRGGGALGAVQDVTQPVYGWFAAGCHWNRRTEAALEAAGFRLERIEHGKLQTGVPAIWGVARAP